MPTKRKKKILLRSGDSMVVSRLTVMKIIEKLDEPSAAEIARATGMTPLAAHIAATRLSKAGFAKRIGTYGSYRWKAAKNRPGREYVIISDESLLSEMKHLGPSTLAAIAAFTGISRRTTLRRLGLLLKRGLVNRLTDNGVRAIWSVNLTGRPSVREELSNDRPRVTLDAIAKLAAEHRALTTNITCSHFGVSATHARNCLARAVASGILVKMPGRRIAGCQPSPHLWVLKNV